MIAAIDSPAAFDHEELVVRHGRRSGVTMAVAVHSTALGPALGGVRMWRYPDVDAAIADALRLAGGMTLKAAAAGLDLGGGKGVIWTRNAPRALAPSLRRDVLLDFGDLVESLDGRYVTAEDVGTSSADMTVISTRTRHVVGLPPETGGVGDPSPFTAAGVEAAMRACAERRFGSRDLGDLRVVVIGLGHVGARLAGLLAEGGARLGVTDVDPGKRELADRLGARWIDPGDAATTSCDILAPCALGGVISAANIGAIRAAVVCGAANNQLADDGLAAELSHRGVVYAPDFLANAGGLITCYGELHRLDAGWAHERVLGIETTMLDVLLAAETRGLTPLAAARELAGRRLHPLAKAG